MTEIALFKPLRGGNQKITATTTAQIINIGSGNRSIRVVNTGAVVIYFTAYKATDGTLVATVADTPVNANSSLVIEKPVDSDRVSLIADSATSIVHFQAGEGGF